MKRLILLLSLFFPMVLGAQQWEIGFEVPSVFIDGLINEDNTAIIAGYQYENEDDFHSVVYKVGEKGEYETFSYDHEFDNVKFIKIVPTSEGYFLVGVEETGSGTVEAYDLHIAVLDSGLSLIAHKQLSAEGEYSFRRHHDAVVRDGNIVVLSEVIGDGLAIAKPAFLVFDEGGELIAESYPKQGDEIYDMDNLNFSDNQLRVRPDGSGYVVIAKYTLKGMRLLIYDNDFNFKEIVSVGHPEYGGSNMYNDHEVSSDLWMSDDEIMLMGTYFNHPEDEDRYEVIISGVSLDGTVNKYEVISSDTCHSAFIGNNAMSYVNDSTIYGGYHSYSSDAIPFHTQICLFTQDLEILGTLTVKDRLGYSDKSLLTYDNGDVLLLGSINSYKPQLVTEASITRFSRNDFSAVLNVNEVSEDEIANMVYPNPTDGELNIDIRGIDTGSENRVRIIDVNGRTLMSRIIRGSGNVLTMDVSSLDAGVYVYEVFNAEGTISKGRFVKK